MVASELTAMINGSGLMPSANELTALGRCDLANQITRRGGYASWATRLGAVRKHSDSDTGWSGEIELAKKLQEAKFCVERMIAMKSPYDLRVEGMVRIDVKSAKYAEYGVCRGWFYRIGKDAQADILALYQLDTGICYFLPWYLCPITNVTISRDGGKYVKFRDRYDLVRHMVESRREERSQLRAVIDL